MDEHEDPLGSPEKLIDPVEVRFGDVIAPPDDEAFYPGVVVDARDRYLHYCNIVEENGNRYLGLTGTLNRPVRVVGHWSLDEVLSGIEPWSKLNNSEEFMTSLKNEFTENSKNPPVMYVGDENGGG